MINIIKSLDSLWLWILSWKLFEITTGLVSGLTAALIFEIFLERFRKPNLIFEIDPASGTGESNQFRDGLLRKWKFLNIIVYNKHRTLLLRWLDRSANNATAKLSFRSWDSNVEMTSIVLSK